MNELKALAKKWGTDKALYYCDFYDELLTDRRESVRKVLEFGIGDPKTMLASVARMNQRSYITGASLQMWEEYFPHASIFGLDYNQNILINRGRIQSYYCDQGDPDCYKTIYPMLGKNFDLVIDDGSHLMIHQLLCLKMLFPLLKIGGLYVIEDAPWDASLLFNIGKMGDEYGDLTVKDFQNNPLDPARVVVIRK